MVDELFKDRKPNIQKLLSFGFAEQNDIFSYSKNLADGQFKMTVSVSRVGTVNATVPLWGEFAANMKHCC